MKLFKEIRQIPDAAIVDESCVAFNMVTDAEVKFAAEVILDTLRTQIYYATGEMAEEF